VEVKISEIFTGLMKRDAVSMTKVSREAGVKYCTLVSWKNKNTPKIKGDLLKVSEYFKVPLVYLLFGIWQEDFETKRTALNYFKRGENGTTC